MPIVNDAIFMKMCLIPREAVSAWLPELIEFDVNQIKGVIVIAVSGIVKDIKSQENER